MSVSGLCVEQVLLFIGSNRYHPGVISISNLVQISNGNSILECMDTRAQQSHTLLLGITTSSQMPVMVTTVFLSPFAVFQEHPGL